MIFKKNLPDGELNPGLPRDSGDTHHYTIEDLLFISKDFVTESCVSTRKIWPF